jgi:hypothetical protein
MQTDLARLVNPYEYIFSKVPGSNFSVSKLKPKTNLFYDFLEVVTTLNVLELYRTEPIKTLHVTPNYSDTIECFEMLRESYSDEIQYYDEINDDIDAIRISAAAIDTDTSSLITELQLKADLTETQPVAPAGYATVGDNSQNVTTAGTRVQLTSQACKKVIITAKAANTGTIWVGGSTVASGRGRPLVALQAEVFEVTNINAIYIDSTVNGEGITYTYFN